MATNRRAGWLQSLRAGVMVLVCACVGVARSEGQSAADPQPQKVRADDAQTPALQGTELDRLVEVVNGEVILESDIDEERRLAAFQPFRDARSNSSREQLLSRLIDRTLILQQARLQPEDEVTDKQVDDQLTALRKEIPTCKQYHCETDKGWLEFVTDQGFTMDELRRIWHERMEVLRYIEVRFRSGIHIEDSEIRDYYEKILLPQYARGNATPPKLETISNRIQEILLQQRVSALLGDWLKSLRAQGTVRVTQTNEAKP